jgi:hypothetical protein
MTALILLPPPSDALVPSISNEAQALKSMVLDSCEEIQSIESETDNESAVAKVNEVSALIKRVKNEHKAVKEPYLRVCQALDKAKNEFLCQLEAEEMRVNTLAGNWRQDQLEITREAQRARDRELARIEAELLAEQRKAESERIQAEAERLVEQRRIEAEACKANSKKAKEEAAAKLVELEEQRRLAQLKAEAEQAQREAMAEQERVTVPEVAPPEKTAGQAVKVSWTFEVLNICELAKVRPDLVKMEPRTAEINELINALGVRALRGLRIFEQVKTFARPVKGPKPIEV